LVNWKVYDMDVETVKWYISYAKLHFNNKACEVLELGKKLIEERDKKEKLKIDELEEKIKELEQKIENKSEEDDKIKTLGGDV
jgi:DNA-binding protein H-NS